MHWGRKWQPTPVFLPGESQGGGAWWAAVYGVTQSWTRPKRLSSSSSSTYHIVLFCLHAKSLQSSTTLCHPTDCSLPGFSLHGILQARILEWVAIAFSRGSSQPRDQTTSLMSPALAGRLFTTSTTNN